MFIISADSDKLADSVQRDYMKAAEAHRQAKSFEKSSSGLGFGTKVGIAISGLVALAGVVLQFAHV
jgi:hypothetical protein